MGWQDRDYPDNQIHHGGNPFANPILKILFGSLPLGTWFDTRLRVHASLLWYIILSMIFSGRSWQVVATSCGILFATVLLHEFGHVFACRLVGGSAQEILLWPLGGLAFCRPPHRPWPNFITVAGGPLVNVIICAVTGSLIFSFFHVIPPLNPLITFYPAAAESYYHNLDVQGLTNLLNLYSSDLGYYLIWIFNVSWSLLIFNLLPMFPMDGGQMLQSILWPSIGYHRATRFCCYVGIILSICVAIFALIFSPFLILIAAFAFMHSYQTLRFLNMNPGDAETDQYDLSAAWEHPDHPTRKKLKKRWITKARKKAKADQAEQAKIDVILVKVKDKGLHSLTWWEKRTLKKATERQRQQDLAERL